MICRECGYFKMEEVTVRKGGNYRSKIVRHKCPRCGYEEAGESTMERLENDRLDEEVKEKMKAERKGLSEPFIDPT